MTNEGGVSAYGKVVESEMALWGATETLIKAFRGRGMDNQQIMNHLSRLDIVGQGEIAAYLSMGF